MEEEVEREEEVEVEVEECHLGLAGHLVAELCVLVHEVYGEGVVVFAWEEPVCT